jgi:hypothetical protein
MLKKTLASAVMILWFKDLLPMKPRPANGAVLVPGAASKTVVKAFLSHHGCAAEKG